MIYRLRHLTDEQRSPRLDRALGAICAFVAGGINAGGFMIIGRYTSHITGIISEESRLLYTKDWREFSILFLLTFGFGLGALLASYTVHCRHRFYRYNPFSIALMSSGFTMIVLGIWGHHHTYPLITEFGLFFSMGIQNATVTLLSHNNVRATHMTGIMTDLGIELGKKLFNPRLFNHTKYTLGLTILSSFIVGGIVGVLLFTHWLGIRALLLYGCILVGLSMLSLKHGETSDI